MASAKFDISLSKLSLLAKFFVLIRLLVCRKPNVSRTRATLSDSKLNEIESLSSTTRRQLSVQAFRFRFAPILRHWLVCGGVFGFAFYLLFNAQLDSMRLLCSNTKWPLLLPCLVRACSVLYFCFACCEIAFANLGF